MPPFLGREPATLQRTMAVPETRHRCKHDRMTFECAVEGEKEAYLAATLSVRQMTPGPAVLMAVLGRAAWPLRADLMEPFMAALDLDTLEASEALGPLSDPFAPSILSGRRSMRWWSGVAMSSTGTSGWGFVFAARASQGNMEPMGYIWSVEDGARYKHRTSASPLGDVDEGMDGPVDGRRRKFGTRAAEGGHRRQQRRPEAEPGSRCRDDEQEQTRIEARTMGRSFLSQSAGRGG